MPTQKIMLIRHAEKPEEPAPTRGIDILGRRDQHSLSVRGWRRAGALAAWFGNARAMRRAGLAVPAQLYACAVGPAHVSKRSEQTIAPLAERLGLQLHTGFTKGDEAALAQALEAERGHVLICWEHEMIPDLAIALSGKRRIPPEWPDARFDVVWLFERKKGKARFSQVAQALLSGDIEEGVGRDVRD